MTRTERTRRPGFQRPICWLCQHPRLPARLLAGGSLLQAGDVITAISMDRDYYFGLGSGWLPELVDASGTTVPGEVCLFVLGASHCDLTAT